MEHKKAPSFWTSFVAGGISGTVGAVATCPLEVVKTRFQSTIYATPVVHHDGCLVLRSPIRIALSHIYGTGQVIRGIYQNEGILALWKGMGPLVVGVMPARAINFAFYTTGKKMLTELNGHRETPLVHLTAGLAAGITTATFTNPIWVVKTRLQLQEVAYNNSFECIKSILMKEGYRGFYKGISASYLGTLEGAFQWLIYERLKRTMKLGTPFDQRTSDSSTWHKFFLIGAVSKFTAAVITYPHEVLRTRLRQEHVRYRGIWDCTRTIFAKEGMGAFYNGLTPHLLRVVPNSAILFLCYEMIIHLL